MKAIPPKVVVCPPGFRLSRHTSLCLSLALLLGLPPGAPLAAQERSPAPAKLDITVVEGENAINRTQRRTARAALVRVEDEKRRPIQGAAVIFTLPASGPSGTFGGNDRSVLVSTDSNGRAVARNLRANDIQGKFQIQVQVSYRSVTATTSITQVNSLQSPGARGGFFSGKKIAILAAIGAAAAVAIVLATGNGGSAASDISISPGSPTIGGPQ